MKCPDCMAELRFDPSSGKLVCDYCGGSFDPKDERLIKTQLRQDADENTVAAEYADSEAMKDTLQSPSQGNGIDITGEGVTDEGIDVIEYTCPNCGGTLISVEESVNGFCSYCGSQSMLRSRFSKMQAPKAVIPFSVTKSQCRDSYLEKVKKAFFAPKELKDPEYLEKFRGIYIPYYVYNIRSEGTLKFKGEETTMSGSYEYTNTYECKVDINASYSGLSYDASSSFDDHFSELIAPFDASAMKTFSTSYLAGFYADLADIPYTLYMNDAGDYVRDDVMRRCIEGKSEFSGLSYDEKKVRNSIPLSMTKRDISTAFFPVWFLSYRKGNRVAYAVVNGETGKTVCDLPVDIKKFILCSLSMALPLYICFNLLLPVMRPEHMLVVMQIICCVAAGLMFSNVKKAVIRDDHLDDRGYIYKYAANDYDAAVKRMEKEKKKKANAKLIRNSSIAVIIAMFLFFGMQAFYAVLILIGAVFKLKLLSGPGEFVYILVTVNIMFNKGKTLDDKKPMYAGGTMLVISSFITLILTVLAPAHDAFYYAAALISGAGVLAGLLAVIFIFNQLSTRPLPQLARKGGDDSAPLV